MKHIQNLKTRVSFLLVAATFVLSAIPGTAFAANGNFGGGNGTSTSPYQITDCADLQAMENNLSAYYILDNDINCDVAPYNTGSGFEPVGTNGSPFTGNLNGNSFSIENLFINLPSTDYVGLFGAADGATISDLGLTNINITADYFAGGLVALAEGSNIENVFVTGALTSSDGGGASWAGGLAGNTQGSSTVTNAYSSVTVAASGELVGGLVGVNSNPATILNSFSTANLSGPSIGSLVGENESTITNSYSVGATLLGDDIGTTDGGSTGGVTLADFYKTNLLYAVYTGTPAWDFSGVWMFADSSSLPILSQTSNNTGNSTNNTSSSNSTDSSTTDSSTPDTGYGEPVSNSTDPLSQALIISAVISVGTGLALLFRQRYISKLVSNQ